jgi:hypothetical protein
MHDGCGSKIQQPHCAFCSGAAPARIYHRKVQGMSSRARLLLVFRITGQALAAAEAGAFASPTGALLHSSAVFHESANLHLTRLGNAVAVAPLVGNEDGQLCHTHDATERRQQLFRGFVTAATPAVSVTPWSLRSETLPSPLHRICCRASFASQAGTSCGGASNDARRRQPGAVTASVDPARHDAAQHRSGWTRQEVWNVPNAISMARLVSGPLIAYWIVVGRMDAALLGLAISGDSIYTSTIHCWPFAFIQRTPQRKLLRHSSMQARTYDKQAGVIGWMALWRGGVTSSPPLALTWTRWRTKS